MAASKTCMNMLLFYLHLPAVIAKINRNNQVNAIRNEHSYCSEGLGSKIQDDGTDLKGLRWCYAQDRRTRRHLGSGTVKGFCIDHGLRPTASFIFAIIMLAGDVCLNPGPRNIRKPCSICSKGVRSNQGGICCDQCNIWFHTRQQSLGMPQETYDRYVNNENLKWFCSKSTTSSSYNSTREHSGTIFAVSQPDMCENMRTKLRKAGLKLAHINVRDLLGKFNEITLLLEESNIDILAVTETHLDRSVRNETVKIFTGYEVERHDRDKNGGGCLLYWKENLDVIVNSIMNATKATESVWIELHIHSQRYLMGSIYRPPDKYDFYEKLKIVLDSIWIKRKNIILMGDLNSDLLFREIPTNRFIMGDAY